MSLWLGSLSLAAMSPAWFGPLSVAFLSCDSGPPPWPEQFVIVQRKIPDDDSGNATTVTWYDWRRQANLIQVTPDSNESDVLWDLELGSGHSYYFTPTRRTCMPMRFPVGVLRPDWLKDNSTCLGKSVRNGRQVIGWTKVDFIDYYASETDGTPVSWYFHTMKARFDSVLFLPGQAVPDAGWLSPPEYCANERARELVAGRDAVRDAS